MHKCKCKKTNVKRARAAVEGAVEWIRFGLKQPNVLQVFAQTDTRTHTSSLMAVTSWSRWWWYISTYEYGKKTWINKQYIKRTPWISTGYTHTHRVSHIFSLGEVNNVKFRSQKSKDKKSDNICILIETCQHFQMQNRACCLTGSLQPS